MALIGGLSSDLERDQIKHVMDNILQKEFHVMEKLVSSLKQQYMALYEGSPDLLRTIDCQGIILNCNENYVKKLGYTKQELIGTSIFETVAEQSIKSMRESFETWKRTGSVSNRVVWLKRKDGTIFPALISANSLYDEDHTLIGSNTVIRDISEVYSDREELNKIKKINREKERLATMISHDLKIFLHPIIGYSEMLKDPKILGALNAEQLDATNEILVNSKRLERLISDIHDVLKLEMNKIKIIKRSICVTDILNMVSGACKPFTLNGKIKIQFNIPKEKLYVYTDSERLFQVLMNLITNAIDFVPKNNGRVKIGVLPESKFIIFYVRDNGIGIAQDEQGKLFDEFYQVEVVSQEIHKGSGLGLAICKGLVENMGGRIWVESKKGKGTTIYFSTPK